MVSSSESTSSTSYTDLTTTTDQVTINVGQNGVVLLIWGAQFVDANSYVGVDMSGANTATPSDPDGTTIYSNAANISLSRTLILTGLNPGSTTFKLKYRAGTATSKTFLRRYVGAIPL